MVCSDEVEEEQQLTVHSMDCKLLLFCHLSNHVCLLYATYVISC